MIKIYQEHINGGSTQFLLFYFENQVFCIEPNGQLLNIGSNYLKEYMKNIERL